MMSRQRFARRIATRFFVRFDMSLIFAATVGTALLATRLLFLAGVETLALRYALAVIAAYAVFFAFVRAWVFYVTRVAPHEPAHELPDVWPSGGAGEGTVVQAGGGGVRRLAAHHVCPPATRVSDVFRLCFQDGLAFLDHALGA
jgi:hypothetical protein